ncbi:rhomboid-domain-containing protein [Fomitiporia mediterranea MF3/22]|uniref:rhomboid-domain-containing protein n=1 Tax=Fomitiporia mediterranea (strain MF3/22) TaxID=694068 RepID=UPI000440989A|nr:rhomboid-domain-containing protein [Fomitiporia mediterranea MF3/22]EJD03994.1 rhomboid-domain-containing protein [Fomitiporia mediterranea MF3/22]
MALPHQKQVNFADFDDGYSSYTPQKYDPYESHFQSRGDATSIAPSHATSGFLAHDSPRRANTLGETEAQELANSYQTRASQNSTSTTLNEGLDRRPSGASKLHSTYGPSGKDPLVDDEYTPYSDHPKGFRTSDDDPLVHNAADMGKADGSRGMGDLEYQDPYSKDGTLGPQPAKESAISRFLGGKYPLEQRIENKRRGIGRQRYPFLVWILTIIMCAVFIYELAKNGQEQGTPVSFKPVVNYMLGPSESALIFVGARFPPCMKNVPDVPVSLTLPCMNDTANPPDRSCPISELCGFGGIPSGETPNQWFRFITPIFLHAGFIHIILNMLAQLYVSAQLEREMGTGGFFLVYFAAGIFGNILGGNFSLVGVPSVGASGAIFGTVAVSWVDLFAHWKYHYRPSTRLIYMIIELILGIGMGFIPYVDNFAHLGGFLMGLLVGMIFYPVISETRRHNMITWGFRIAAVPLVIVLFVVLTRNFYTTDPSASCGWCRYLSCIPTNANNHCKGTGITTTTTTTTTGSSSLRMLLL